MVSTFCFLFLTAVLYINFSDATISNECLRCICEVESGCRPLPCAMDEGTLSCGYYQIKSPYYIDCYSPGASWKECAVDKTCAENCIRNYMERYGGNCPGGHRNCECYARLHNGGPNGNHDHTTLYYWRKVQAAGCHANS